MSENLLTYVDDTSLLSLLNASISFLWVYRTRYAAINHFVARVNAL